MNKFLEYVSRGRVALGGSALILLALFVWYYPGEAPSGDAAYKYLQVKDFIRGSFSTFACDWPGQKFDPAFDFFPFQEPMAYIIEGRCYYVFPYQLVFVYLPFYMAFGNAGIYLVSLFAGWLILLLVYGIGRRLGLDEREGAWLVWFTLAAFGLSTYALGMNEFTLTCALTMLALTGALRESRLTALAGGLFVGLALQFRAESALLGCTLPAAIWLFATDVDRRARALVFFGAFAAILIGFFAANQAVFGHPLGLRGIVFLDGQQQTMLDRIVRLIEYWGARPSALLINTPLFALAAPALYFVFRDWRPGGGAAAGAPAGDPLPAGLRIMGFVAVTYAIGVPFLVANYPGAQFGERFLFNVYPVFGIVAFMALRKVDFALEPRRILILSAAVWIVATVSYFLAAPGDGRFWLAALALQFVLAAGAPGKGRLGVAAAMLAGTLAFNIFYLSLARTIDRGFHTTSRLMAAGTAGVDAVVFRNYVMVNAAFAQFHDRPQFLAVEDEKFLALIEKLRAAGMTRIAVGHSSPAYRKQLGMHAELVPEDFQFKSRSEDRGNELIELRRFEF